MEYEAELSVYAHEKITQIPGLTLYGDLDNKIGIISFTMDCAHTSDIAMILNEMGIATRSGHHCCMPLMQDLNVDSTVRASIGLYNNKGDIDRLIAGLEKVRDLFG